MGFMYDLGYDEELPAGFQDADLDMLELERAAAENARCGRCGTEWPRDEMRQLEGSSEGLVEGEDYWARLCPDCWYELTDQDDKGDPSTI